MDMGNDNTAPPATYQAEQTSGNRCTAWQESRSRDKILVLVPQRSPHSTVDLQSMAIKMRAAADAVLLG